jgi:hypothetical protein
MAISSIVYKQSAGNPGQKISKRAVFAFPKLSNNGAV